MANIPAVQYSIKLNNTLPIKKNDRNRKINVSFDNVASESVNISVFVFLCRKIFENDYQGGSNFNQNIQLNNAQPGVYLLNVTDGERKEVKRIIVE